MRLRLSIALLVVASTRLYCQQPATTPPASTLPKDPHAIFEAALPHYNFSDPTLNPWHLKATYQLFDFEGKPTLHGTWEYWAASPKVHRNSWQRTGMSRTDWSSEDGTGYLKKSGEPMHYFERKLQDIILHPGPNRELIEAGRLTLGLKTVGEGSGRLTCLTTLRQQEADGKQQMPAQRTPDLFCFDPGTMALMVSYSNQILIQCTEFVKMQDLYIPRKIAVRIGKQTVLSASVESIDNIAATDPAFDHPADADSVRHSAQYEVDASAPPGNITKGKLVKKTFPDYPPLAKSQHIQGTVILGATIGADGKIHNLEILAAPSRLLADSAVDCVSRWEYKPYLLNGEPLEVETTIKVIYTLGG